MPKFIKVCSKCGSCSLVFEADARWDVDKQDYVLSGPHDTDTAYCGGPDGCGDTVEVIDAKA